MNILQTPTFKKHVKKLHKNQKFDLDNTVKNIVKNPFIGEFKKGDLNGVLVYKFKIINQLTLLTYEFCEEESQLILMALGAHENFYRDLKS